MRAARRGTGRSAARALRRLSSPERRPARRGKARSRRRRPPRRARRRRPARCDRLDGRPREPRGRVRGGARRRSAIRDTRRAARAPPGDQGRADPSKRHASSAPRPARRDRLVRRDRYRNDPHAARASPGPDGDGRGQRPSRDPTFAPDRARRRPRRDRGARRAAADPVDRSGPARGQARDHTGHALAGALRAERPLADGPVVRRGSRGRPRGTTADPPARAARRRAVPRRPSHRPPGAPARPAARPLCARGHGAWPGRGEVAAGRVRDPRDRRACRGSAANRRQRPLQRSARVGRAVAARAR